MLIDLNDKLLLEIKTPLGAKIVTYFIAAIVWALYGYSLFKHVSAAPDSIVNGIVYVLLDWKFWVINVLFITYILNLQFRRIEIRERTILVKRWYAPTRRYLLEDIQSAERDYSDEDGAIKLVLKDGKVIRIPSYLMEAAEKDDFWEFPKYGGNIITVLNTRLGNRLELDQ